MSLPDSTSPAAAPSTPFEWIGGEARVRQLVDRFYDLMDLEPGYTELRAAHGPDLASARDKLFWFLCGWLGGPDYYQQRFGHVFLIRAAGRSLPEILSEARRRTTNTPEDERREVAEQLREIAVLRLEGMLS